MAEAKKRAKAERGAMAEAKKRAKAEPGATAEVPECPGWSQAASPQT